MFLHMVFLELGSPLLQRFMGEVNFTGIWDNAGQTFVQRAVTNHSAVAQESEGSSLFYTVIFS